MKTVLAIGAHPDDIEIGCGGALASLKANGYRLIFVVATAGEQGGEALKRKQEASKASKVLGAEKILFLDLPDGLITFELKKKIELIKIIRQYRPEIVFTHSQSDHFPDHKVIHCLSQNALTAAAGPWYPAAGTKPFRVKKIYGYEVWHPMNQFQVAFDISKSIHIKIKALKCHASQIERIDYVSAVEGLALYRGAMSMKGRYAEVFEIIYHEENL